MVARRFAARLLAVALAALGGVATPARAGDGGVALSWDAPASCPATALLERVARLTGLRQGELPGRVAELRAVVRPKLEGGWAAALSIRTSAGAGERSFEADDCEGVVEAAALILALAIDPTIEPTLAAMGPTAAVARTGAPSASPANDQPGSEQARVVLGPLALLDRSVLPSLSVAAGIRAGIAGRRLRAAVDAQWMPAQTVVDARDRGGRLRVLAALRPHGCILPWLSHWLETTTCAGATMTWMRGTGVGIRSAETGSALAVEVVIGGGLGLRLQRWLWLHADLFVGGAVRRPRFEIEPDEEVHQAHPVTTRFGFALEVRL